MPISYIVTHASAEPTHNNPVVNNGHSAVIATYSSSSSSSSSNRSMITIVLAIIIQINVYIYAQRLYYYNKYII